MFEVGRVDAEGEIAVADRPSVGERAVEGPVSAALRGAVVVGVGLVPEGGFGGRPDHLRIGAAEDGAAPAFEFFAIPRIEKGVLVPIFGDLKRESRSQEIHQGSISRAEAAGRGVMTGATQSGWKGISREDAIGERAKASLAHLGLKGDTCDLDDHFMEIFDLLEEGGGWDGVELHHGYGGMGAFEDRIAHGIDIDACMTEDLHHGGKNADFVEVADDQLGLRGFGSAEVDAVGDDPFLEESTEDADRFVGKGDLGLLGGGSDMGSADKAGFVDEW